MKSYVTRLALLTLIASASCTYKSDYHKLSEKLKIESKNYQRPPLSSTPLLEDLSLIKITEGKHSFFIPDRKSRLASFACSECHTQPLKEMKGSAVGKSSHWDVQLTHADENTMNCATCHDVNSMDHLTTLTGKPIDMNFSYKLCAQCHAVQFKDWKGGAHGKKIKGWAPPRASMTCVNCHNPHKPGSKTRWPARLNTQKTKEQGINTNR